MPGQLKKRKAIATVLTTMIILIASVVLGSGVVMYDTSTGNTASPTFRIDVDGAGVGHPTMCFISANGPISLKPGESVIIYFHLPTGVLDTIDSGQSTSVALYAGKLGAPVTVTIANP